MSGPCVPGSRAALRRCQADPCPVPGTPPLTQRPPWLSSAPPRACARGSAAQGGAWGGGQGPKRQRLRGAKHKTMPAACWTNRDGHQSRHKLVGTAWHACTFHFETPRPLKCQDSSPARPPTEAVQLLPPGAPLPSPWGPPPEPAGALPISTARPQGREQPVRAGHRWRWRGGGPATASPWVSPSAPARPHRCWG